MKCSNSKCNGEIEDWLTENVDADGNKYCDDCISKLLLIAEQEGLEDE